MQAIKNTWLWIVNRFPKGSIWQTTLITFPLTLVASSVAFMHSELPLHLKALWFLSGIALWTLLEYILHRWLLHYVPKSIYSEALLKRLHILHHENTKDQSQVCLPLVLQLPIWTWIYISLVLVGGGMHSSLLMVCGIAVMMTVYDIVHFSVHYMDASNPWFRYLKKHHMVHHFSKNHKKFGVTSPLWDFVFKTYE